TEHTAYTITVKAMEAAGNESVQNPTATFTTGETILFTDTANHWAKDYIQQAAEAGMMNGYPDGTFKPNQNMTRAQVASILVRSLRITTQEKAHFTD
ncbi:S-layer homology domain-containing protein, partial [Lysinibacillus sp. D4A3_S15]|uniref:S-layer homology domain-containing protein n=1 Tax=Lysinibacillus sp. D4A3_S15 TaxID=2941227 RepID=UPI0020BFAFF1